MESSDPTSQGVCSVDMTRCRSVNPPGRDAGLRQGFPGRMRSTDDGLGPEEDPELSHESTRCVDPELAGKSEHALISHVEEYLGLAGVLAEQLALRSAVP